MVGNLRVMLCRNALLNCFSSLVLMTFGFCRHLYKQFNTQEPAFSTANNILKSHTVVTEIDSLRSEEETCENIRVLTSYL